MPNATDWRFLTASLAVGLSMSALTVASADPQWVELESTNAIGIVADADKLPPVTVATMAGLPPAIVKDEGSAVSGSGVVPAALKETAGPSDDKTAAKTE